jgi:hypothetical protein
MNKENRNPLFSMELLYSRPIYDVGYLSVLSTLPHSTPQAMSTPMDDPFYPNDMDNYSLQQYTDFSDKPPYGGGVDPRLLSSPQNTPILSNEQRLSPFDYTIFSPHTPSPTFFEPDLSLHSYEPMRHQMLGHRRSVSVPPEDMMPETVQPPPAMVFHRGGTPLGDSMGGNSKAAASANKKWLKKAAAAQKRQLQRHAPYHMDAERMQVKRSHTQPLFSQQLQTPHLGPTSAPQQMVMATEDQISQAVMQGFDMSNLSSPQFAEFNAGDAGGRGVHLPTQLTDVDALAFETRGDVGTAVLGMLGFAERISKDCEVMREFLKRGFKAGEEDEGER